MLSMCRSKALKKINVFCPWPRSKPNLPNAISDACEFFGVQMKATCTGPLHVLYILTPPPLLPSLLPQPCIYIARLPISLVYVLG